MSGSQAPFVRWARLGDTQYRDPTVRLLAAAVGVYGISALVILVNAPLAGLLGRWVGGADKTPSRRDAWISIAVAGVAVLVIFWYARAVWQDPTGGPAVRVGLLQGNIEQAVKWDKRFQVATLEIYERLGRRVAAERPVLIVWPETAVPFFFH